MTTADTVISFRVPAAEYEAIQRAAAAAEVYMSSYIRQAIRWQMETFETCPTCGGSGKIPRKADSLKQ